MQIETFVDNQFQENAYVVYRQDGGPCWIVDPGFPPSPAGIIEHIDKHKLQPTALVLTHGHLDHIAGVPAILDAYSDIAVYMAAAARPALTDANENVSAPFGWPITVGEIETIDLPHGSELTLDGSEWLILESSGHAPGSRSLYCEEAGLVIVGDALFMGSIGRTDFPHSNHDELIRNIKEKLFTLPDETRVFSGHGPVTTIGQEKQTNPFLQ